MSLSAHRAKKFGPFTADSVIPKRNIFPSTLVRYFSALVHLFWWELLLSRRQTDNSNGENNLSEKTQRRGEVIRMRKAILSFFATLSFSAFAAPVQSSPVTEENARDQYVQKFGFENFQSARGSVPLVAHDPCPGLRPPYLCPGAQVNYDPNLVTMHDFLLAKVVYSNFATLRPGSIYELRVHFEENLGFPQPTFNYLFSDTGLGAAEPLYAVFQSGHQASYLQLLESAGDDQHLDHFSDMVTPEGCRIQSVYIIRGIQDFPNQFQQERAEGYTLVDISWDYTTRLNPKAECGRHRANDPDPNFDPIEFVKPYLKNFQSMDQIPADVLAKFEAKINLEKTITSESSSIFNRQSWPTYADQYSLKANSLWYYPKGHAEDYGVNKPRPQPGYPMLSLPRNFVLPVSDAVNQAVPLSKAIQPQELAQYKAMLQGQPVPGYDATKEPGGDAFSIDQITTSNFLTAGRQVISIRDPKSVQAHVLDPANYRLVEAVVRPFENEIDYHHPNGITLPEMRLVYQWIDPKDAAHDYEQVFVHLTYNAVDRLADPATQKSQQQLFMSQLNALNQIRQNQPQQADAATAAFLKQVIAFQPVESIAFSSSLTGIWVFGQLTRGNNAAGELVADNISRHGLDVGYYSTAYDNQIFRDAAAQATGARKAELQDVLDSLTPTTYRDARRNDTSKIAFNNITCAQCHQMAGRDGIHVRLNDFLDSRVKTPAISSEYLYRELDRQLKARAAAAH